MENIPRIRTRVNRIMKKFMEKFPNIDLSINNWEFFNPETKKLFEVFESGYKSCPSFSEGVNYVVGRLDDEGLTVSKFPRTHTRHVKAQEESARLAARHASTFVVLKIQDPIFSHWAEEKIKRQKAQRAITDDIRFTVYWKHGERSVITGKTIEEAFGRAGFGQGAIAAVDWYDNTDVATHEWDTIAKKWSRINPFDFEESQES